MCCFEGCRCSGIKFELTEKTAPMLPNDVLADSKRSAVMMGNNTCMNTFFKERISKVYDKMYSQRSFVHWFVYEGMEEGEFAEAREDLGFLEKDYLDLLYEEATDEDSD